MNRSQKKIIISFATLLGISLFFIPSSFSVQNKVDMIQLNDDMINPVTAEYIVEAIDRAYQNHAQCLIIKLDTPGGLLNSTRLIVKKMLTSKIPIVVYISPSGSRAGSAGVFLTYASHIAAMAPSTNIGAAHPVEIGQESPKHSGDWDELRKTLEELKEEKNKSEEKSKTKEEKEPVDENPLNTKILNDTVAFIKAIAQERHRNVEWAVKSVTQSESITSDEALEKGVIEIIAHDDQDLLNQLNGRVVKMNDEEKTLATKDAQVVLIPMNAGQKFFNILANPNIAYLLMILGFYGLLYEITHPGFGVPGVLGITFLILAFYSLQTLPTNYAGVALMVFGLGLLVSEAFVPGFGFLLVSGIVCLILGSLLLFQTADPLLQVSKIVIFTFTITTTIITLFLLRAALYAKRLKVRAGQEGLMGEIGEARGTMSPGKMNKVFVHGEIWNAVSDEQINAGEKIIIEKIEGLTLKVKKLPR